MDNNKIWEGFIEGIKANTTPASYRAWFESLYLRKIDNDTGIIYLAIPEEFKVQRLKDNYMPLIERIFNGIIGNSNTGNPYRIVIKTDKEYEEPVVNLSKKKSNNYEKLFNPKYNFDDFIVGDCNKLAFAVCVAVAETPGESYNPLFIYGGSGLGKTHLMQSIGVYIGKTNPNAKVLYVSAEMFLDEYVTASQTNALTKFDRKYKNLDVLLIDDIQFLSRGEKTQEQFFIIFQHLYNKNKQIVVAADCSPTSLKDIDDRLRTRFSWNMVADLQPPDYETRLAILFNMAEKNNLELTDELKDVCCLIAEQVTNNVRELEGAFTRVISFSNLLGEKITVDYAKSILKDIISNNALAVAPERIRRTVASQYGIKLADMDSSKRNADIALPRQVAMYLCRQETELSLPKIGNLFGNRHYSTVIHAVEKIQDQLKYDNELAEKIEVIKAILKEKK